MSLSYSTMWKLLRPFLVLYILYTVAFWAAEKLPSAVVVNIAPWEAGVRQDNFGGGLQRSDLRSGSHYEVPGFRAIQAVDMRGRLTAFGTQTRKDSHIAYLLPAVDIRTLGNQSAQVALSVAWHITDGTAYQLVGGALLSSLDNKVADKLEEVLQVRLAALDSDDWSDTRRRQQLANELEDVLRPILEPYFVSVDGVYIEGVRFSADYEKKLQEQQVSHQLGLLKEATGRVEEARAKGDKLSKETAALENKLVAEWNQVRESIRVAFDLDIAKLDAATQTYIKATKSETEAEYAAKVAEGERLIAEANAFAERRRLELLGTPGGQVWLAMRAADQLNFGEVWLDSRDARIPSMLDIDAVVAMLMGQGGQTTLAPAKTDE